MTSRRYRRPGPVERRPARDLAELQQRPELDPPEGWIWGVCFCGSTLIHPDWWVGHVENRGYRWGRPIKPERRPGALCSDCGAPYKVADGPHASYHYQPILPPTLRLVPPRWPLFATMAEEKAWVAARRRRHAVESGLQRRGDERIRTA